MSTPAQTEEQILKNHSPRARARAEIEMKIVNAIMERATETKHTLDVPGEEDDDFRSLVFNIEVARVRVRDAQGKRVGMILLVFGNSGWDLVSDYSISLEDFLAPINALAESLE